MSYIFFIATFAAYFIKGLSGFANTIVFTTILSFFRDNKNISPLEVMISYPSDAIMAFKNRKKINKKECTKLSVLIIIGSIPGIYFLKMGSPGIIKCILGAAICLIGVDLLIAMKRPSAKENPVLLWVIGIVSGVLCGMFGIGAMLASYFGRTTKDTERFKANINMMFLVDATFRIIAYSLLEMITIKMLINALMLIPCMLAGLFLGIFLAGKISDSLAKKIIIVLLFITGGILFASNIRC